MGFIKILYLLLAVLGSIAIVNGAIGGKDTKGNDGDFFVQIYDFDRLCGGLLVNRRWVLTYAKCVQGRSNLEAALGLNKNGYYEIDWKLVDQVIMHPNHTGSFTNNLALLHLYTPAKVGQPHINVVDGIPSLETEAKIKKARRRCFYYSRGLTRSDDGKYQTKYMLTKVGFRFIRCKNSWKIIDEDPRYKNQLSCYKSVNRGDNNCADAGAPMLCRHQGQWLATGLVGLSDRRNKCRASDMASFDLAMHRQWIMDVIG